MQGVFLVRTQFSYTSFWLCSDACFFSLRPPQHVLADVLGSVGVIISTILVNFTGWTGWDPIASLFIATLIVASVVPLVIDSGKVLALDAGPDVGENVRSALAEVRPLPSSLCPSLAPC
jgi:hypothetical protein